MLNASTVSINSFINFPVHSIRLTEQKQVHHWKVHPILVKEQHGQFAFRFYLYAISSLE
jgi:hypothetical protein